MFIPIGLHIFAEILKVHRKAHVVCFEVHSQFVYHLVGALGHHNFRDFKGSILYGLLDDVPFIVCLGLIFFRFLQTGQGLFAEFGNRLAVGVFLDQFVGHFRNFTNLDILDMDLEDSGLASQFLRTIILRERHIDIGGFILFQTNHLVFKARNKAAGTDFQGIALAFAAFKRFTVDSAGKINRSEVSLFQFTVFRSVNQFSSPFLQVADGIVHIFISDFTDNLLEVLVFTQFNFRTERDQKGHFHFLAFFQGGILQFGICNRNEVVVIKGLSVIIIGKDLERFFLDGILTDMGFQDPARSLSFSKARNCDLFVDTGNGSFETLCDFFNRNSEFQSCFVTFSFYRNAH